LITATFAIQFLKHRKLHALAKLATAEGIELIVLCSKKKNICNSKL